MKAFQIISTKFNVHQVNWQVTSICHSRANIHSTCTAEIQKGLVSKQEC